MPDFGHAFTEFVPKPQSSQPVTNLSPHVDGGQGGSAKSNVAADADEMTVLRYGAAIILVALALLWMLGGFVFKSARF